MKNKTFYTFLFVIFFYHLSNGQSLNRISKKGNVQKGSFEHSVKFDIEQGKYILRDIKINNITGNFILDTGSDLTLISNHFADLIGFVPKKEYKLNDMTNEVVTKCGLTNITIGNILFSNIAACIVDDIGKDIICNIDGIIGNNLIRQCVWQLSNSKIIISDEVSDGQKKSYKENKLILMNNAPYFIAKLSIPRATFLFDLGDNSLLNVDENLSKYIKSKSLIEGYGNISITAFENREDTVKSIKSAVFQTDTLKIFDYHIYKPISYVSDVPWHISLGSELLDYVSIILDYKHKKVYSKQIKTKYSKEHFNTFGFKFEIKKGEVIINYIWNETELYKNNIKLGSQILSINDINLRNLNSKNNCFWTNKILHLLKNSETIKLNIKGIDTPLILKKNNLFSEH